MPLHPPLAYPSVPPCVHVRPGCCLSCPPFRVITCHASQYVLPLLTSHPLYPALVTRQQEAPSAQGPAPSPGTTLALAQRYIRRYRGHEPPALQPPGDRDCTVGVEVVGSGPVPARKALGCAQHSAAHACPNTSNPQYVAVANSKAAVKDAAAALGLSRVRVMAPSSNAMMLLLHAPLVARLVAYRSPAHVLLTLLSPVPASVPIASQACLPYTTDQPLCAACHAPLPPEGVAHAEHIAEAHNVTQVRRASALVPAFIADVQGLAEQMVVVHYARAYVDGEGCMFAQHQKVLRAYSPAVALCSLGPRQPSLAA